MGILRGIQPLIHSDKVESEIKIAKGKFLLSRYDKIRKRKDPQNKAIPLKDEELVGFTSVRKGHQSPDLGR